jgi:hypothetical protein
MGALCAEQEGFVAAGWGSCGACERGVGLLSSFADRWEGACGVRGSVTDAGTHDARTCRTAISLLNAMLHVRRATSVPLLCG